MTIKLQKEYEYRTPYSSEAWRTSMEMVIPSDLDIRTELLSHSYLHYIVFFTTIKEVLKVVSDETREELEEELKLMRKDLAEEFKELKQWLDEVGKESVTEDVKVYKTMVSKFIHLNQIS